MPASCGYRTLPCACLLESELSNSLHSHTGFSNCKEIIEEKLPFLSCHPGLSLLCKEKKDSPVLASVNGMGEGGLIIAELSFLCGVLYLMAA